MLSLITLLIKNRKQWAPVIGCHTFRRCKHIKHYCSSTIRDFSTIDWIHFEWECSGNNKHIDARLNNQMGNKKILMWKWICNGRQAWPACERYQPAIQSHLLCDAAYTHILLCIRTCIVTAVINQCSSVSSQVLILKAQVIKNRSDLSRCI